MPEMENNDMDNDSASAPASIASHTVKQDETLGGIAQQYYGHMSKPYWMHIYDHNKEAIGDNPGVVRVGTELNIPELTAELKD